MKPSIFLLQVWCVIWLKRIFKDFLCEQDGATTMFCDNLSAIEKSKKLIFHARLKHIKLKHHFVQELVEKDKIELKFINTKE